jgi:SAM-dependent methyltransferase
MSPPRGPQAPFYADLDRFIDLCHRLTEAGQPYTTVLLCHELYRFLYPVEPYASFHHGDPVGFLTAHLRSLIALGAESLHSVRGYSDVLARWSRPSEPHDVCEVRIEETTSNLYSDLWVGYDDEVLTQESRRLLTRRIPERVIDAEITGRTVLDLGCGSGRYSIALACLGARSVTAVDYRAKSYQRARAWCFQKGLPVTFLEADALKLPFQDRAFDFVFCNGVLHHTRSWRKAMSEYARIMRRSGFLYLYATGGFFWTTRRALRPRPGVHQAGVAGRVGPGLRHRSGHSRRRNRMGRRGASLSDAMFAQWWTFWRRHAVNRPAQKVALSVVVNGSRQL